MVILHSYVSLPEGTQIFLGAYFVMNNAHFNSTNWDLSIRNCDLIIKTAKKKITMKEGDPNNKHGDLRDFIWGV